MYFETKYVIPYDKMYFKVIIIILLLFYLNLLKLKIHKYWNTSLATFGLDLQKIPLYCISSR